MTRILTPTTNQAEALMSLGFSPLSNHGPERFYGRFGNHFQTAWKSLRRAEKAAHRRAEQWCNGEITEEQYDKAEQRIIARISKLFHDNKLPAGFFINSDPRGYALKLDNEKVTIPESMERDWGGYGILAPDKQ